MNNHQQRLDDFRVNRTHFGARSVKGITKTTSSGNTLTYPLYDIHGNMVAALSKAGSTFSVGEARTYDAWGQVRSQVGSDGKSVRYRSEAEIPPNSGDRSEGNDSRLVGRNRDCANLGHKQDDESGLIYMRARYYEPSSGRFVSEDAAMDGPNWMVYCNNDPVNFLDKTGKFKINVGNYTFEMHYDLFPTGDLHIKYNGKEIVARDFYGFIRHGRVGEITEDMVKAIVGLAKSGHSNAKHLLNCFKQGMYGCDPDMVARLLKGTGLVFLAYTSVDAYAQFDPVDFMDIMLTIGTFGKH